MNGTWLNNLGRLMKDNSPAILSGAAVGGVIATAVLAAKGRAKAEEGRRLHEREEPRGFQTAIQEDWQCYIPAAITGAATIACVIGANQIGARRNAALLGAYTLADTAFREYKDAVVEELGKDKDQKIRDKAATKKMTDNPAEQNEVIITGGGDQLCYDTLTGRYFRSDIEKIRKAQNDVNQQVLRDMYCDHNRFYELVGLPSVRLGEELGWNIDHLLDLVFTSHLGEDGVPCLAVDYRDLPVFDYGRSF